MAKSELREYIEALLISAVIAALIIAFVAQSFLVEGSSMEPSLYHGQRLWWRKCPIASGNRPGRGCGLSLPWGSACKFIKRIIGLPGMR